MTVIDVSTTQHRDDLLQGLITDHSKALIAYARTIAKDHHLAEDVVQETFFRAWVNIEKLHSREGSLRGWLLTVTRNLMTDRLRSAASRHESVGVEDHPEVEDHAELAEPDIADDVLHSVDTLARLQRLSQEHREVLWHIYWRDRTVDETARILGVPSGTVKSRQHYALAYLRTRNGSRPRSRHHHLTPGR
jgi:RNA polymerase sigma-70 factor (ECF subfamily)